MRRCCTRIPRTLPSRPAYRSCSPVTGWEIASSAQPGWPWPSPAGTPPTRPRMTRPPALGRLVPSPIAPSQPAPHPQVRSRLTLVRLTLVRLTLVRLTVLQLTLARLTVLQLTLARLTVVQLTLARLTLAERRQQGPRACAAHPRQPGPP